jgi:hypothetical protein
MYIPFSDTVVNVRDRRCNEKQWIAGVIIRRRADAVSVHSDAGQRSFYFSGTGRKRAACR